MKASEVYLRAAELLFCRSNVDFCCTAISDALRVPRHIVTNESKAFALYFREQHDRFAWMSTNGLTLEEEKPYRALALLLMSEIAKDEEKLK